MKTRTPPHGTTHLEWTSTDGKTVIVAQIEALREWMQEKGVIRYGKAFGDSFQAHEGEPIVTAFSPDVPPLVQRAPGEPARPMDDKHPHWKGDNFVPEPPRAPGAPIPPPPPKQSRAPRPAGGESVCCFIDGLIMQGGRTKEQIADLVLGKWPERDRKSTLNTIGVRPTHIKAKGLVPPPFKK